MAAAVDEERAADDEAHALGDGLREERPVVDAVLEFRPQEEAAARPRPAHAPLDRLAERGFHGGPFGLIVCPQGRRDRLDDAPFEAGMDDALREDTPPHT